MLSRAPTIDRRLFARRCVACGYDGALLRAGQAERCARCGCDLRRRPARSYAEMEGLTGQAGSLDAVASRPVRGQRFLHRWLAFFFVTICTLVAVGYLMAVAIS